MSVVKTPEKWTTPTKPEKTFSLRWWHVAIASAAVVAGVSAMLPTTPWRALENYRLQNAVEKLVRAEMVDPESAKFRNFLRIDKTSGCIEANGKNRMGGYAGFSRSFVDVERGQVSPEPAPGAFDEICLPRKK